MDSGDLAVLHHKEEIGQQQQMGTTGLVIFLLHERGENVIS